jgi:hypothetical protein
MLRTASPARRSEKERDVELDGVTRLSGQRSDRGVGVCDANEDSDDEHPGKEETRAQGFLPPRQKGLEGMSLPKV